MTARRHLTARERADCFDGADGVCHLCSRKIAAGEPWEVSHPIPLAAGGKDEPTNRRPAHKRCHATQTATIDAPLIAKVRRVHQKHIGARIKRPWPGTDRYKRKVSGETVDRATGERT